MTDTPRIAILIDADNVEPAHIRFAVEDARGRGRVVIRRAVGRLTSIKGREKVLTDLGFSAEVAFSGARATKDTADLMLAQIGIRLAERGTVEVIALVSSDSDFATIARGIAESGVEVIGYGKANTPAAFREAVSAFVAFPENGAPSATTKAAAKENDTDKARRIIEGHLNKAGEGRPQVIGQALSRAFDGNYKGRLGVKTFKELIKKLGGYEILDDPKGGGVSAQTLRRKA
ncbi:NYN domain-containing protein [Limibaculum sp. M0105]|uniref:NYN domain-containing protein n=1 Tax=Thermohalobaculum xanthum TaxID=2753746 RepID=A0A8J7MAA2_9RHOB|nr:NYN domain-containing protein [Thermohalobaculum xanthum]MBK0400593.1 NYN domain-containing protein [Thermohalobaculum xanthum]